MSLLPVNPGSSGSGGGGLTQQEQQTLAGAQQRSEKNSAGGYAGLDSNGQIDPNAVPNSIAEQVTAVFDPADITHAPNSAAIAGELAGKANSADVPDLTAVSDGDVPVYDAATGKFKPSGIKRIDDGSGNVATLLPENAQIESHSLSIGDTTSLGEAGSFLVNRNKLDSSTYFVQDYKIDPVNGTSTPHIMDVGPVSASPVVVQPLFNNILTGTMVSATFTSTQLQLISSVYFKVAANMTNVRMRVVDVASGKTVKWYPSKAAWFANTGDPWAAGDHTVDLQDNQIQIPSSGLQYRLDVKADSISLRGSSTQPYLAIQTQNGGYTNMATQPWAQNQIASAIAAATALYYNPLDSNILLTGAATESRILSAITQAQATRRQVGTWSASTNTPTLTNPPTTIGGTALQIGDYVEVTAAGSQFGITWAVGDIAKVVQVTGGSLGWYKDPVQNDKFDSKNVWASQAAGSDANSGSLYRPKQTLSGAIAVVAQPGSIHLTPGVYAAGALTISKTNVNIFGEGVNANNSVEISGQITTAAGRIRLRNVNFTQGSGSAFTWNDSTGGHHIQDISTTVGQTGPVFTGSANAGGVLSTISNGDLSGSVAANNIVLANRASGTAGLYLVNLANVRISVGTGWIVYVNACPDIQITGNTAGVVWVDGLGINAILTQQSQLTALQADTNVATDGYYICDFSSPTVGARNDILLKKSVQGVATNIQVNRPYAACPASVSVWTGAAFEVYNKRAGGWVAPANRSTDTSAFFVTKVNSAMGTPGTPYQMTAGDNVVQIDNNGAVGVRLPAINSVAIATQTRRYTISCPRAMSSQTVALSVANGTSDVIVGGPMGHPNGQTTLYMTPGDSVTLLASVDAVGGNCWVIESLTGYDTGADYYWGLMTSSTILTSWGGYWHVSAAAGNVTVTLPMSSFGKAGSYVKLIRTDTNNANTVTLACAANYTINGAATQTLAVGGSVVVSTHTSGNQALLAEFSSPRPVPIRCAIATLGGAFTVTAMWGFQMFQFASTLPTINRSDFYGMHNPNSNASRVVAPTTGLYRLSGSFRLDNRTGGTLAGIRYYKNGTATPLEYFQSVVAGNAVQADFTANIQLNAGDYVEMGVYADIYNTNLTVWYTNFSVELMG